MSSTPGQNVTSTPGQSVTATPGQNVTTAPAANGPTAGVNGNPVNSTSGQAVAGQGVTPQGVLPGQSITTTGAATGTGAQLGVNGVQNGVLANTGTQLGTVGNLPIGTRTAVAPASLPAAVQQTITAQLPAGAQLAGITAETTASGQVLRAQYLINGAVSDVALSGIPASTTYGTTLAGNQTVTGATAASVVPGTAGVGVAGFGVATPYVFDSLPVGVQSGFTTQANGQPISNITYASGPGGGVYRAMANGRPLEIRVLSNGNLVGSSFGTTSTNDLNVADVPSAVRDAIKNGMPDSEVTRINRNKSAAGVQYDVLLKDHDRTSLMQVSENGTVIRQEQLWPRVLAAKTLDVATNDIPKLNWSTLPVTVRDAIEVETDAKNIRSLVLTNYQGKTAYSVDWLDKDSLRNRTLVGKDGLVLSTVTNLYGIRPVGSTVLFSSLPMAAQAIVEEQGNPNTITQIELGEVGLTPVYIVNYRQDGELQQMIVSRDGLRMDRAEGAPAEAVTGAATGEAPVE